MSPYRDYHSDPYKQIKPARHHDPYARPDPYNRDKETNGSCRCQLCVRAEEKFKR